MENGKWKVENISLRIVIVGFILSFLISCDNEIKNSTKSVKPAQNQIATDKTKEKFISIYDIDFKNFTYPWMKKLGGQEKSFTLKNGSYSEPDGYEIFLQSVNYDGVISETDALVTIRIDDGNASTYILYVYGLEKDKLKFRQSFEFEETNISLKSAYVAHGELIIETYNIESGDAQCCPSVIERKHYKWNEKKFVLVESQKIANNYIERKKKEKNGKLKVENGK